MQKNYWTIGKRITFGFACVIIIVAALGAFSYSRLAAISTHSDQITKQTIPLVMTCEKVKIVLKEGRTLTPQEVKAHCRRFLEDFKVPQAVEFVSSLPKTQGGKIKRSG